MLGRYQVEKELGKGAMGVVYLGRDPKIGRVVAIKTMLWRRSSKPTSWQRSRTAFSARPRPQAGCRIPISSRSTTRARSTTCATSRWSCSRARTWCPIPS